jgi:predicted nucleic acid-binding Zn ribbon protein
LRRPHDQAGAAMSRRRAPRPATEALRTALERAAPKTPLAAVQASWMESVGERVAAAAEPVSERAGTLVVRCSDPVWANELELMQDQLLERLRERLGDQAPQSLRFRVKEQRNR